MNPAVVAETHISVLIFINDRVYKLRKPVTTPFLDFSTRELRLADCQREVYLNRRLAPDVYLGVYDITDETGAPIDHLVVMRRLPAERRLSAMVAEPGFDEEQLVAVARRLTAFHASAERSASVDTAGSVAHLRMLWSTNIEETAAFAGRFVDGDILERVGRRAFAYLDGRGELFAQRVADGRIVDGHGDLLAEDVFCLDDGPRILDCIEFDPMFRWGDVLNDAAFLAMDLEHLGRGDLARRFLAAYRELSGETHPVTLEHWYIAYRALVRAKVSCLRADGEDPRAAARARGFLDQADRRLTAAEVHLVLVGGLPGTGKTTVAEGLADRLGWVLIRSDTVRKELAGLPPAASAGAPPYEGIYAPDVTADVYRDVLHRAELALAAGESVVLDATWLDPGHRRTARRLASHRSARLHELCCEVDLAEAAARIADRMERGGDASDATPQVLASLARRAGVPWEGAVRVDTGRAQADVLDDVIAVVRPDLRGGG